MHECSSIIHTSRQRVYVKATGRIRTLVGSNTASASSPPSLAVEFVAALFHGETSSSSTLSSKNFGTCEATENNTTGSTYLRRMDGWSQKEEQRERKIDALIDYASRARSSFIPSASYLASFD